MYSHILVPTDGSEVSQHGVDHALALAKALGSRVTIITVTEPFMVYSGYVGAGMMIDARMMNSHDELQAEHAKAVLAKAQALAAAQGVPAEVLHVPDAYAADAIVETATEKGADLIVMASHGRRGLGRLLVGSQTSGVVNHSTVPVLVVR